MKKINNICGEYATMVFNNYYNYEPTLIFYGSNIYDINSSDLDVCIIFKKDSDNIKEDLIKKTIEFHKLYNLKIDEEIPYDNKLVYDLSLINDILSSNPFYVNGEYFINDIVKSNDFLSSSNMKKRLLLNILTTDHTVIGDLQMVKNFEDKAWDIIIDSIIGFNHLKKYDLNIVLNLLYKNQYTGAEGEMYLGYKKNNNEKEAYLKDKANLILSKRMKNI